MSRLLSFFLFGLALAQRPNTSSICDYYALNMYGENTTTSQFNLMQNIIALAFAGGAGDPNVSTEITGIFNPGVYDGTPVDLSPWFNGTKASTNLNNVAAKVNWLDSGGKQPLFDYISGNSPAITFANGTNEERLFSHWITAFSFIFGCTLPTMSHDTQAPLSLAYVHKYMDLNHTDIGHFINQLTLSSVHYGFSDNDAGSLNSAMNDRYNFRCSPAVPAGARGPQLYSLCQDESCPLAFPSPDCAAYENLGPNGAASSSAAATASPTSSSSSSSTSSTSSTSAPSTTTSAPAATTSAAAAKAALSPGGIAGAAIGGAALVFIFIALLIWLLRKRKPTDPYPPPPPSNPSFATHTPSYQDHHQSYLSGTTEHWAGPPIAEMEHPGQSPSFGGSPVGYYGNSPNGSPPVMQNARMVGK